MIEQAVQTVMEVLESETRNLTTADYIEVINQVRERCDGLIDAALESESEEEDSKGKPMGSNGGTISTPSMAQVFVGNN